MKGHDMAKRHYASEHMKKHVAKKHLRGSDDGGVIESPREHSIAQRDLRHEFYAGMDSRRRQELEDAGMLHENPNAVANMPQEVMMKFYPKTGPFMPEELDDSYQGVDRQMDHDDAQRRRGFAPKKV